MKSLKRVGNTSRMPSLTVGQKWVHSVMVPGEDARGFSLRNSPTGARQVMLSASH